MGLGVASLATAGVFLAMRNDALATRDAECDIAGRGPCTNRTLAEGADQDFRTYTLVTNLSLGVGAASVVAGALWLALGRTVTTVTTAPTASLRVVPRGDGAMLLLGGAL